MSLLGLYTSVVQPFSNVIYEIERGGFRVDEAVRERLRVQTRLELRKLTRRILDEATPFYESWMAELELPKFIRCSVHPKYQGNTKRNVCESCAELYRLVTDYKRRTIRGKWSEQRARWGAGIKLGGFALRSDACWRRLLFDTTPHGLGLAASGRRKTAKRRLAQVDKEALAELARAHPDVPVLRLKTQFDSLEHDLSTYLKVVVDDAGYAHPCYHLMTSTGRLASGDDGFEPGRVRRSEAGNMQNVPDRLRRMYVADDVESVLVQLDWRQVEALITAWLAGETQMVEVILDGSKDIHTENALVLADAIGVPLVAELADTTPFPNDPSGRSFRQAGKLTHKLHYGMGADKFSRTYGISRHTCTRIMEAYFARWSRLRTWQNVTAAEAQAERQLSTPFGRVLRFWDFDRHGRLQDREEALAFRPQSIVSDMLKAVGPALRREVAALGGRIGTTTHDSYTLSVPKRNITDDAIAALKAVMQREWPECGTCGSITTPLWCPVDVQVGRCWRKFKSGECEEGLRKWNIQ